jgi:hypothetical protein
LRETDGVYPVLSNSLVRNNFIMKVWALITQLPSAAWHKDAGTLQTASGTSASCWYVLLHFTRYGSCLDLHLHLVIRVITVAEKIYGEVKSRISLCNVHHFFVLL